MKVAILILICATANAGQLRTDITKFYQDERLLNNDSEFTIKYPEERGSGIKVISAQSLHGRVHGEGHSAKKQLVSGVVSRADYRSLIEMIGQLDVTALSQKVPGGCIEPIQLILRMGRKKNVYMGCRDATLNASLISKVARKLEFLLIKNTGISD